MLYVSLFPSLLFLLPLNLLPVFSPQTPEGEILQRRLSPLLLCSRPCCHHSAYGMCLLVIVSALVFYHISLHFRFEAVLSLFASPSLPLFSLFFFLLLFLFIFSFMEGFPSFPRCLSSMCFFRHRSVMPVMFSRSPSLSVLLLSFLLYTTVGKKAT